uniref:Zinc finger piccolo-type domain-containing protein n=1 Tax=Periophthalmus magnuspinnatus TaxID=409849 RepID=A0A3B4BGN3_9GOBI
MSPSKAPTGGQKTDTAPEKVTAQPMPLKKTPEPQLQDKVSGPAEKKEVLGQKDPQAKPQKTPDQGARSPRRQSKEQESGGFFGFGAPKALPESGKPEESVGKNVFGFGSSIFSSASTLITSATSTPPVSPKLSPKPSPAKEAKSPVSQKTEEQKKEEAKMISAEQTKVDKGVPQPTKTAAVSVGPAVKPGQSTCPLCKVQLNINTKDTPNYSNCTECKSTVCKQCGFNPSPNDLTGKEWLCLNCQTKRALSMAETANKLPEKTQKKDPTTADANQKKPLPIEEKDRIDTTKAKQEGPVPAQKKPQETVKTPDQTRRPSNASVKSQPDSGGFFGLGGKAQPDTTKPSDSVSGKMFGFGSSLFSSASTLISSAVQDQPLTTPPTSPKMSTAKDVKTPTIQKAASEKKSEQPQQTKTSPVTQAKAEKASSVPPKKTVSQGAVKLEEATCPLCKAQLNIGSKDAPNYSSCTECKSTVCNQCGFSPMPSSSEVSSGY